MKYFKKEAWLSALATCSILGSLSCGTPPAISTGTFTPTLPMGPSTANGMESPITQETIYAPVGERPVRTNYILLYRETYGVNKAYDQSR